MILLAADRKPIAPPGIATIGPYSPALLTREYLYVSGHLGRLPSGIIAATIEEQTYIVLNQIKTVVEAAGLTMDHVVSTQLFLTDIRNYEAVNKIYATYFPNAKPSRVTVGVARLPKSAGVEITAVAVRNLASKKSLNRPSGTGNVPISEGITTTDRLFLSGTLGRDSVTGEVPPGEADQVRVSFKRAKSVLQLANLNESSLVTLNVYHTKTITPEIIQKVWTEEFGNRVKGAVSIIEVNELALGTHVGVTGIAALNPKQITFFKSCAALGETLYCAAEPATTAGEALKRLTANIRRSGFKVEDTSATQLYLDNIDNFEQANQAYANVLKDPRPARATLQPAHDGRVRVSVVVSHSAK